TRIRLLQPTLRTRLLHATVEQNPNQAGRHESCLIAGRNGALAGSAVSAGRQLRRGRHQLLALLGGGRARRAVALRRAGRGPPPPAAREHGSVLARIRAGRRARPALRLPGLRALGAGAWPSLQPEQAAARPLRQGDRRRSVLERGGVSISLRR